MFNLSITERSVNEMRNNRQKENAQWQSEMDRVETHRKILLLTAFLQEIQEYPDTTLQ